MDDVSTMRPAALFFKWGRAALMLNSIPLRFVANTSSQALSLISSNVTGGKMPAFAQRMSTPPNSAATVAMTSSISPCSLTSPRQNIAVLPRPRRASTAAAPSASFRPTTQTRAPSWAKTPAMPLPMPLVPPVTMTDLFLIDMSTESSLTIYFRLVEGSLPEKAATWQAWTGCAQFAVRGQRRLTMRPLASSFGLVSEDPLNAVLHYLHDFRCDEGEEKPDCID